AGGDWEAELEAALAAVGAALHVDRCYFFQNLRGPDGRLWMDLRGEGGAPGIRHIFEDPKNHLHPPHPDFQRSIGVMGEAREISGPVSHLGEAERRVLEAEGTVAIWHVPVLVMDEWWGFVGIDLCSDRPLTRPHGDVLRAVATSLSASATKRRAEED